MKIQRRLWGLSGLLPILLLSAWSAAQTPLKSVKSPEGGRIMYGVVDGATSQAGGLASVLRAVHSNCGERPQIGRVFRFRGTDIVGVFFTVVNHPAANVKVAGLVLSAMNPSQRVEAALVSDDATRFGKTVNPMLTELFGEWHPATAAAASASAGKGSAAPASVAPPPQGSTPAAAKGSAPAASLHTVSATDNSGTIGIPDGWTLDPHSGGGIMVVSGPHGEQIGLNMSKLAIDPSNPSQVRAPRTPGVLFYPFRGDIAKSFPDLYQAWRRANGKPPAQLQVDEIKPMEAVQGNHCALATGHVDPDGKGMQFFSSCMCAFDPGPTGMYTVTLSLSLVPNAFADQERSTMQAIVGSWKMNQQVVSQQLAAKTQQVNANTQALIRQSQMQVDRIHQIGAQATARMQATEAANEAQHASYWAQQDSNERNAQGFSNYLLDQTVVQDNNMYNNGTIGHGTVWNSTADALVKADPKRFEIVDTPNYWRGIDY